MEGVKLLINILGVGGQYNYFPIVIYTCFLFNKRLQKSEGSALTVVPVCSRSVSADPEAELEPGTLRKSVVEKPHFNFSCCSFSSLFFRYYKTKRSHKQQHALRNSAVVVFLAESA